MQGHSSNRVWAWRWRRIRTLTALKGQRIHTLTHTHWRAYLNQQKLIHAQNFSLTDTHRPVSLSILEPVTSITCERCRGPRVHPSRPWWNSRAIQVQAVRDDGGTLPRPDASTTFERARGGGAGARQNAARKRKGGMPSAFASEGVSYNAVTAMEPHLIDLLDHPVIVAPHLHAKPFLGFSGSHASFAVRKRESTLECFRAPRVERKAACGRT